jgi:hypothetical protein
MVDWMDGWLVGWLVSYKTCAIFISRMEAIFLIMNHRNKYLVFKLLAAWL